MNTNGAPPRTEPWQKGPPPGFDPDPFDGQGVDVNPHGFDGEGVGSRAPAPAPNGPWSNLIQPAPREWFTTPPPARAWLLRDGRREGAPGLLPLGKAGMLISEGGAGKTQLLCQLALAVATGGEFLGCFPVATKGRVILIMGEEDADEARRRLYNASCIGTPTPPDGSISVLPLAGVPCAMLEADEHGNPRDSEFAGWLFRHLDGESYTLTVVDPVSRFAGLEAETNNAHATRFVQSLERIATLTRGTTLGSHHTGKAFRGGVDVTASAARGSSAFVDGFRWVASLRVSNVSKSLERPEERDRLGELVTLSVVKSNYSRKGEPVQLRRDERGGLVPLDDTDRETIARVTTGTAEREAKAASKATERERARDARDRDEERRRGATATAREAATRARDAADDNAVRSVLATDPTTGVKALVALVKRDRACGSDRAHAAVLRVRGAS